jgi:uncharacterized membrane protein
LQLFGGMAPRARRPDPAVDNIRTIVDLERKALETSHWSERVSDAISAFAGSLWFVLCHIALFTAWAAWNALAAPELRFDPFPYGLLTFIVSLEGVLIATFVLIKQNRMAAQSDQRDHLDLQVDLLAEQEMTLVLRMLRRISDKLGVSTEDEDEERAAKLTEETNVYELMQTLENELPRTDAQDNTRGKPARPGASEAGDDRDL